MRGDTNFKGSDSSDPFVYFLLCGNSQFSVSISKCNYLARICVMNMRNATYVGIHATFKGSDSSDSFVSFLFSDMTVVYVHHSGAFNCLSEVHRKTGVELVSNGIMGRN